MDVLSEVLKIVTLDGAIFYNAEFSAPWQFQSPPSRDLAPYLSPAGGHVIIFHLVTEGRGAASLEGGERVPLEAGDIVVFPHGDPHVMHNGPSRKTPTSDKELHRILSQGLKVARQGGGGEVTRFVCGYMSCEPRMSQLVLRGLPSVFKVNIRDDASGRWLEQSIRFSVDESGGTRPGGEAVLALMHQRPAHPWTVADLARQSGVSRSVLAERFRHFLDAPPMTYLMGWRLQLGARILCSTGQSVAQVAAEVGYESEPAFNRAFKREFGLPPARFRSQSRPSAAPRKSAKRRH